MRKGVFYTRKSLIANINPKISVHAKIIKRLSAKNTEIISKYFRKTSLPKLDEAMTLIANEKLVLIVNNKQKPKALGLAKILAVYNGSAGRNVALFDSSHKSKDLDQGIEKFSENISMKSDIDFKLLTYCKNF